ncbi:MAG: isoprenylcysteine carboxylmethyltransferase family protein [Kiloniellales bacterium]
MFTGPMLRAIVLLPGTALVAIPAIILWLAGETAYGGHLAPSASPWFWLALPLFAVGFTLMGATMRMFMRIGKGTPAPWAPPRKLVVAGVYRRVRNPMISGVITVLLGESLLFQSLPLLAWAVTFALANWVYIPRWEEPALYARFGEDYRRYSANVPRWIPRLKPWMGEAGE